MTQGEYLDDVAQRLDANAKLAREIFEGVDIARIDRVPGKGQWSAGQCLDHLVRTESPYVAILEPLIPQLPSGNESAEFKMSGMGKFVSWAVSPKGWLSIPVPDLFAPGEPKFDPAWIDTYAQLEHRIAELALACKEKSLTGAIIASPANEKMKFRVAEVLNVCAVHGQRHLQQAKRILAS